MQLSRRIQPGNPQMSLSLFRIIVGKISKGVVNKVASLPELDMKRSEQRAKESKCSQWSNPEPPFHVYTNTKSST